jgi:hypothetical protein
VSSQTHCVQPKLVDSVSQSNIFSLFFDFPNYFFFEVIANCLNEEEIETGKQKCFRWLTRVTSNVMSDSSKFFDPNNINTYQYMPYSMPTTGIISKKKAFFFTCFFFFVRKHFLNYVIVQLRRVSKIVLK